ncbi:hypothetical protein Ancab_034010 [Ancistrocladus abbreviatus]
MKIEGPLDVYELQVIKRPHAAIPWVFRKGGSIKRALKPLRAVVAAFKMQVDSRLSKEYKCMGILEQQRSVTLYLAQEEKKVTILSREFSDHLVQKIRPYGVIYVCFKVKPLEFTSYS